MPGPTQTVPESVGRTAGDRTTAAMDAHFGVHDDVVLIVRGALDPAAELRLGALVRIALECGTRRMIIDLTGVDVVPQGVAALVALLHEKLYARGGCLLVDGGPEPFDIGRPLLEAFSAYREACAPVPA